MSRALLPAYETLIEQRIREATERGEGYVPPEALQVSQINQLVALAGRSEFEAAGGDQRLRALLIQLELAGRPVAAAQAWQDYQDALIRARGG